MKYDEHVGWWDVGPEDDRCLDCNKRLYGHPCPDCDEPPAECLYDRELGRYTVCDGHHRCLCKERGTK